jgi:hypothetical protein
LLAGGTRLFHCATVDFDRFFGDNVRGAFRLNFPFRVRTHLAAKLRIEQQTYDTFRQLGCVPRRDKVPGAAMFDHFREPANSRRYHGLSSRIRERDYSALRCLNVGQDCDASAAKVLGGSFFGDISVINDETLRMEHHPRVTGEIFSLSGDQDANVRHTGAYQGFSPNQVLKSFVFPDAAEEENQVFLLCGFG